MHINICPNLFRIKTVECISPRFYTEVRTQKLQYKSAPTLCKTNNKLLTVSPQGRGEKE